MDARRIPDGRSMDDLPDRARIFFKRMTLPPKMLELIIEAQPMGMGIVFEDAILGGQTI